jgi:3-oxoacyl-[acyl-carrier protein] reductase
MDLGLEGKVAVVLAASKGLGKAAARELAGEGCRVAICSRDEENIKQAAEDITSETNAEVLPFLVDVEKPDHIKSFISEVQKKWQKVDILVNNAGGPPVKTFDETTDEEWETYFNITLMSVIRAIREVIPGMKKQKWGRIINITSISVKEPIMGLIYSNSLRLAVVGLAKTLSRELGPDGITIHNVAPGFHRTDGLERIVKKRVDNGEHADDIYKEWEQSVPVKKIGEPEDLAALIAFLASDRAHYMSGTTIAVDGGRVVGVM